jgi:hypothetical protein
MTADDLRTRADTIEGARSIVRGQPPGRHDVDEICAGPRGKRNDKACPIRAGNCDSTWCGDTPIPKRIDTAGRGPGQDHPACRRGLCLGSSFFRSGSRSWRGPGAPTMETSPEGRN